MNNVYVQFLNWNRKSFITKYSIINAPPLLTLGNLNAFKNISDCYFCVCDINNYKISNTSETYYYFSYFFVINGLI